MPRVPDHLVRLDHDGPLAVITIERPPLNLFDETLVAAFAAAITASPRRTLAGCWCAPRAVTCRLAWTSISSRADTGAATQLWVEWFAMIHELEDLRLPTIFAAHGLCLTAAFEISPARDLLLAAESARFALVETVIGLTPRWVARNGWPSERGRHGAHAATKAIIRELRLSAAQGLNGRRHATHPVRRATIAGDPPRGRSSGRGAGTGRSRRRCPHRQHPIGALRRRRPMRRRPPR